MKKYFIIIASLLLQYANAFECIGVLREYPQEDKTKGDYRIVHSIDFDFNHIFDKIHISDIGIEEDDYPFFASMIDFLIKEKNNYYILKMMPNVYNAKNRDDQEFIFLLKDIKYENGMVSSPDKMGVDKVYRSKNLYSKLLENYRDFIYNPTRRFSSSAKREKKGDQFFIFHADESDNINTETLSDLFFKNNLFKLGRAQDKTKGSVVYQFILQGDVWNIDASVGDLVKWYLLEMYSEDFLFKLTRLSPVYQSRGWIEKETVRIFSDEKLYKEIIHSLSHRNKKKS